MKTYLLLLLLLNWTGIAWGQIKIECKDTIPQYQNITEIKISDDTLFVKGFINENVFQKNCQKITISNFVYTNANKLHLGLPKISLLTVPIKIRPKTKDNPANADSGLDNLGLNFDFLYKQWDRYFVTGRNSTHRISAGVMIAPLVQELTKDNTKNGTGDSKQLFLSTGISLNYSYNKILFTLIPAGVDFSFNKSGKDWINNGNYWWGFGIGADLKILENIFDK